MTDVQANLGAHRAQQPCTDCGAWPKQKHDRACPKAKRGRTARQRGNAYEREVAKRLGVKRVGQYGGKTDVAGEWIVVQCKNGDAFPERIWSWLGAIDANADQLRAVVIGDAPGPGTKRRSLICIDLDDFVDWYCS